MGDVSSATVEFWGKSYDHFLILVSLMGESFFLQENMPVCPVLGGQGVPLTDDNSLFTCRLLRGIPLSAYLSVDATLASFLLLGVGPSFS